MPGATSQFYINGGDHKSTKPSPMNSTKPPVPYKPPGLLSKQSVNKVKSVDKKCSDNTNANPKIRVTPSDQISLKSETSSVCRPLHFPATNESNETKSGSTHQINDNQINSVYNACETQNDGTIGSRSSRFPTLIQCKNDSTEEKTVCCANLAVDLYNKAIESAKRALPHRTKRSSQFPRSFGEDFESLGPEGFNYLDDGQTECSYDYRDIEFNRDSLFRPDVLAETGDLPIFVNNPSEEPTNLNELQAKYGLPEEADRVQPYKRPQTIKDTIPVTKPMGSAKSVPKTESNSMTEVAINKDSDSTTHISDTTTNAIEAGIIVKSRSPSVDCTPKLAPALTATPEPVPSTSSFASETLTPEPIAGPSNTIAMETTSTPSEKLTKSEVKDLGVRARPLGLPSNRLSENMDQLAKRTSQLILENAFESIAKSKAEDISPKDTMKKQSKKSSTESNARELKKEKKLLEKKLKEEEKNQKKLEKEIKSMERTEKKKLFDRFRSEDKQKRKIQKKQKEFEKLKRKLSEKNTKDLIRRDIDADIEADDEYEPTEANVRERPYEDIDDFHSKREVTENVDISVTVSPDQSQTPASGEVNKMEVFDGIREIGVTYVPSDDGIENENYDESGRKPKSKSGSFRLPKMDSFRSKVISIFPKKSQKASEKDVKKSDQKTEDLTSTQDTAVPEIIVGSAEEQRKIHEYENVDESNVESTVRPSDEPNASQWETEDEERLQFIERVSRVESPLSKKRKKSKTRAKLDRFKAKAMESLPNIKSIVPKVKGLVGGGGRKDDITRYRDMDYETFISSQSRNRYDSDFDCVSDSELCDSLRRTGMSGGMGRHHVYEEMAATQERVDAYMSPVSGPLRPPRRFSSLKNVAKVASTPSLATQVILRPKRIPPPRPPPPRPPPPKSPPIVKIVIESNSRQNSLNSNSLKRRPKQRVPPEIYYNNLRMNFKPKRRFVNLKPNHMAVLATYDEPKPPIPVFSKEQIPTVRAMRAETLRRVQQKNVLNSALNQNFCSNNMPLKERFLSNSMIIDCNQKVHTVGPTPPPRRKRKADRSQTMDPHLAALDWQPFSWKTRRCRSLTELDVRQKKKDRSSRRIHNYENIPPKIIGSRPRTPRPGRPPLPTSYYSSTSLHSSKRYPSDNYHIYASISRIKGHPNAGRPLPPPPVPPRPKCIPVKAVPTSGPQPVPKTRDVSVSTKDNGLIEVCEKQTQIDGRNQSLCEDLNGNLEPELDAERTPTNPLTPTTPTNQTQVLFLHERVTAATNGELDLADQCVGLNESTVTLSSVTTTNWFDAENPEPNAEPFDDRDYDENTLNDDISSIASVYQSFSSDVTVTESREQTPVPEVIEDEIRPLAEKKRTPPKPAVRSMSTKVVSDIPPERPVTRRSLPSNANEAEDSEEMFGMSRELHSELKNILEKRASDLSSDRPESFASSEASQQEKRF